MKKIYLSLILLLLVKIGQAQTFNCYIANDHLLSPKEYVFDVYIRSTAVDFLFRTYQGCFTFDSNFVSSSASVTASYDTGSTQLNNYLPGSFTWSGTAPGFMMGANVSVTCANGTLISQTPVRIGTFRMTITSADTFNCAPSNPNMVLPGELAAGLALKTQVSQWDDTTCGSNANSVITSNGLFTQSGPHTLYANVNNMAPIIVTAPVNDTICRNETAIFNILAAGVPGYGPVMYQWYENGSPISDGSTVLGTYSGSSTPTLMIDFASVPLSGHTYSCGVYQCNAQTSTIATLTVNNLPTVNLGPDTLVMGGVTLDAGLGFSSYAWSTGETTQSIFAIVFGDYWVSVTDSNGCSSSDTINIFFEGIDDLNSININLYPNPANGSVLISGIKFAVNKIEAINSLGQIIQLKGVVVNNDIQVNTSELAAGIYNLKFYTDSGNIVKKLVVN